MDEERIRYLQLVRETVNASPFYEHIGMRAESFEDGSATVLLEAGETLTNLYGTLHGGALASLVDSAGGLSLATRLEPGETAVTIDLDTTYLIPARPGKLTGVGRIVYRGRTVGVTEVAVTDEEGNVVVHGKVIHAIQRRDFWMAAPSGSAEERGG